MDIDSENKWAVYPIEKIEAAMRELSEAIVMARQAQREADERKRQVQADLDSSHEYAQGQQHRHDVRSQLSRALG